MAGTEGSAQRCSCSPTARTPATPRSRRPPRRSATPRCWSTSSRSSSPATRRPPSSSWPRPAADRSSRPTPRPCRRRSPPRPTSWPGRCWSRPTLPAGFDKTEATVTVVAARRRPARVTAEAFVAGRAGHERRRSSLRQRRLDPAVVGALRRPGSPGAGPGVPRGPHGAAQARRSVSAADRVTQLHRDPGRRCELRQGGPLFDADVTFASAKETAANVLRRNKDLDARISARLEAAGSELKSSEWLLRARRTRSSSPAWSALLLGGGNLLIGFALPRGRRCSARGCTSASGAVGAARRSTRACPTRCS